MHMLWQPVTHITTPQIILDHSIHLDKFWILVFFTCAAFFSIRKWSLQIRDIFYGKYSTNINVGTVIVKHALTLFIQNFLEARTTHFWNLKYSIKTNLYFSLKGLGRRIPGFPNTSFHLSQTQSYPTLLLDCWSSSANPYPRLPQPQNGPGPGSSLPCRITWLSHQSVLPHLVPSICHYYTFCIIHSKSYPSRRPNSYISICTFLLPLASGQLNAFPFSFTSATVLLSFLPDSPTSVG